jgi:hypothetical protein
VRLIRKFLILVHRYLGIVLSIPIAVWFISGIAMIYARGMPSLTPELRSERLPILDTSLIRLSPLQAAEKAQIGPPDTATLTSILGRPAYRLIGAGLAIVFADNGELMEMGPENAARAAAMFAGVAPSSLISMGVLESHDQWSIGQRPPLPLHKFSLNDSSRTELYVSELTGEVALITTRGSRALAWVAAIPHWFYLKALRENGPLWRRIVLWTSGLGTISALIGLVLAVVQYRRKAPHIPYSGWLRWHYITGVVFGVFTVTFLFSGFLSMEPWYWASDGGLGAGMREALAGGPLDVEQFPRALPSLSLDEVKEVEYLTIQGSPYYQLRGNETESVLVSAATLQPRTEAFSSESLLERLKAPNPDTEIVESTMLENYDSYYYSFERKAPLPVLRVKFADPDDTWFYIDPQKSEIVARATRKERLQRWIYRGFHSLDFSFWYYYRPLWDIGVIALCLGGTVLSGIGIVISWKRVARSAIRIFRRDNA